MIESTCQLSSEDPLDRPLKPTGSGEKGHFAKGEIIFFAKYNSKKIFVENASCPEVSTFETEKTPKTKIGCLCGRQNKYVF